MKKFIFLGAGLLIGAAAGSGITYFLTKRTCEERCQQAINDMKKYYEEKEPKNEETEKEAEKDFVRNDKPPITELSSIYTGNNDNSGNVANYHGIYNNESTSKTEEIKKLIKEAKKDTLEEPKKKEVIQINYAAYNQLLEDDAYYKAYNYDEELDIWTDEDGEEIEVTDLPFEPKNIAWTDEEDVIYLQDISNRSVYELEKI